MTVSEPPILVTGPDDTPRDAKLLLESTRGLLWARLQKILGSETSAENQREYYDRERARDIVDALVDLISAERDIQWLTCDASYYRINLSVTDEDLQLITNGFNRKVLEVGS